MKLNELRPAKGSTKARKRVGRGVGSGRGKTAGRGHKGQKSRSGFSQSAGWDGGRSRLIMRLPKRGFNRAKTPVQKVNVGALEVFEAGSEIDVFALADAGLIRHVDRPVKLLGDGELTRALVVDLDAVSAAAARAVEAAGGTVKGAATEEQG